MSMSFNPLDYSISYQSPRRLVEPASWVEHIPFAMVLIEIARPVIFVELGTHSGNSYCAFCQAVLELKLNTKCYAIDTWEGDEHAGNYGPDVLKDLIQHHNPIYGHFSNLVKSTFDNAVQYFDNRTIDLLHIDGLHTYEAVKHDFETWQPKLSDQAVVVLHDTNVREREFGVWRFWNELQQQYPSWEFFHGHGLGILGIGDDLKPEIKDFFTLDNGKNQMRRHFQSLGARLSFELETRVLQEQLTKKTDALSALNQEMIKTQKKLENVNLQIEEQKQAVNKLSKRLLTEQKEKLKDLINEHEKAIQEYERTIEDKNADIRKLNQKNSEKGHTITAQRQRIEQYKQEVLFYSLSKSWRITRPLRKMMRLIKGTKND